MKILVINAGSSSLKYQLIDMQNGSVLAKGNCERIGTSGVITHKANGKSIKKEVAMPSHIEAFNTVANELTNGELKVIDGIDEISAVGHRVVHGGQVFKKSTLITEDVVNKIEDLSDLAPLHNPAGILGIRACQKLLGDKVPQVAVFDTSFHSTLPDYAYMYALPYEYYEKYGVRKYGFHGTSHKFVSQRCAELLNKDIKDINIVTCHLGNGCSVSAVKGGECVDTSMGFTPVDGMMMGTRCGSIDPSALTYIGEKENLSYAELNELCNKKSGLLGISGLSNDSRDVCDAADEGDKRSLLATTMQEYQVLKLVGSYVAAMGGTDAIVFTGGLGENNERIRRNICDKLSFLGISCDYDANNCRGKEVRISTPDSKVAVFVIPTDEEMVIARDTKDIVEAL